MANSIPVMIALLGSLKLDKFMMRLTIIGFGNQAKAWALNLKDSGYPVRVALRPDSSSLDSAIELGLNVVEIGKPEFYEDQAFALLTPDASHNDFLISQANLFKEGSIILYAHGFSVVSNQFHQRFPHLKHILFAPKSIGKELRKQYQINGDLGAVYSLENIKDPNHEIKNWVFELSKALGINLGPYATTFKNETIADLYSEQGLLCSLIPYAAGEMFNNLIESGVEPELAYFECWHELKLIINAMVEMGPESFFDIISPNALIGSEKGFNRLINKDLKNGLMSLLNEIKNGTFHNELKEANVEDTRKAIRQRWDQSYLQKTFKKINREL